jgi:hypothetical protein
MSREAVGQTPWSARDAFVPHLGPPRHREGPAADVGVCSTACQPEIRQ